jgi:hypothetical protein
VFWKQKKFGGFDKTVYPNTFLALSNSEVVGLAPGVNPTIVSYNASAVNIYNATISLVRLENKNIFFDFDKRSTLQQRWRCKIPKS